MIPREKVIRWSSLVTLVSAAFTLVCALVACWTTGQFQTQMANTALVFFGLSCFTGITWLFASIE